jgi:hypothetical protein
MIGNPYYQENYEDYYTEPPGLSNPYIPPQYTHTLDVLSRSTARKFGPALPLIVGISTIGAIGYTAYQTSEDYRRKKQAKEYKKQAIADIRSQEKQSKAQLMHRLAYEQSTQIDELGKEVSLVNKNIEDIGKYVPRIYDELGNLKITQPTTGAMTKRQRSASVKDLPPKFSIIVPPIIYKSNAVNRIITEMTESADQLAALIKREGYTNAMNDPLSKKSMAYKLFTQEGLQKGIDSPKIPIPMSVVNMFLPRNDAIKFITTSRPPKHREVTYLSPKPPDVIIEPGEAIVPPPPKLLTPAQLDALKKDAELKKTAGEAIQKIKDREALFNAAITKLEIEHPDLSAEDRLAMAKQMLPKGATFKKPLISPRTKHFPPVNPNIKK